MSFNLLQFTDILSDEICNSQPISLPSSNVSEDERTIYKTTQRQRPAKYTGQHGEYRSIEEIDPKYRSVFSHRYFNLVQSRVIDDALYSDKSMVVCAPTGSGKTVIFEMAIVQLLMELEEKGIDGDFKIIYMAPVKSLCTERVTEWYPKFTKLGHLCIEVTGDTNVEYHQLKPYRIIITTPEKWNMFTRRWPEHRGLVGLIKLFLIDEVHILNDDMRGPVLEAVVSRMKTIEASVQSEHRQNLLKLEQDPLYSDVVVNGPAPRIRFVAVSATVSNPEDVTAWLSTAESPAIFYKFGDECRPVKVRRIVEGYPCSEGTSIFKFDIILSYKLWPMIQKYHNGKPTLIFCNTRKSVTMTAETLSRELTVSFSPEQKAKLTALASTIKNKKLQALVLAGVGCHHAGLLFEERVNIENSFRNRDLPILITTTTLAMGVNLPAHLVIIKNTQQYVNGAYQEYSISTILQMVGRAGRPQFDSEATAVIMTTLKDKHRYQALVEGSEPLQSYLHKRIAENLNSEAALGTVGDVAQCVQWLRSTFLYVRAGKDPRRYLGLPHNAPIQQITNKMEELCVKAMNGLSSAGLITMDESSCITSTEAGRLMSIYYIDLETMKQIMKIDGTETLDKMLYIICECHELSDMHLRMDERRLLNTLNRNNKAKTIRFPMKGKITTRQMKLSCVIQAVLGCLPIQDPSLNQEAMKIMRIADRICKCIVAYVTRPESLSQKPNFFSAVLNSIVLAKCIRAHLWENSPYVSKQLKGIGPTFSTLLASAGKTSFMLLEESHPRDLERIMNKGAPAGNVLRKQASLLPKYHLTATPSDSNTVTIKLSLLNCAFLSENMENLTAGIHHKCFIIVGDSNNKLLLFTSFQDKDLIDVYDGTMSYSVTRQYHFEHKILAHCISTEYVGIDAECDYVFRELEPLCIPQTKYGMSCNQPEILNDSMRNLIQPSIADIYKERKRKNNTLVTESKEKKKRDCDLIEKFKVLKENFGKASNEFRNNIHKSTKETNLLMQELTEKDKNAPKSLEQESRDFQYNNFMENTDLDLFDLPEVNLEDMEDGSINNEEVDSILNEIEKEINTNIRTADKNQIKDSSNGSRLFESYFYSDDNDNSFKRNITVKDSGNLTHHPVLNKSRKHVNNKSNYSFIDDIEKKNSLDIDLMDRELHSKTVHSDLPDDIKVHIKKYLQNQAKVQVTKDNDIINQIIDPIDWNLDKNKTQQKSLGSKETIEIRDINNSAHRDMDQKIEKEHEGLKNTPLDKEHALAKEGMSEGTHKKHDSPNVALSKNESNAEASEIVKYHSDDDFIILSDCEEDISDLATQKVLPLSLDSDHESCYEHIELDNISMKFQDTSTDQSKNINSALLIYNNPTKSNEVMNSSNKDKNLVMCTNSSYAKSMSALGRNIYIKNSPTEQKCTKEQHSYYNSHSNSRSKKNPYVKGYQYSWTDISVLTKTMPDRQVSMIKKVTVDVNVTEISTNTNELERGNSTQSALLPALGQEFNNEFKIHQPQPNYNLNKPSISDRAFDRANYSAEKQVAINNRNTSAESLGLIETSLITNNDFPAKYCLDTMKNELFEFNSNELNKVENSGNELYPGSVSTSFEMMKSYPIQVTCTKRTKNKFVCPLKVNYSNDVKCNDSRNNNFDAKDNSIDEAIDQHANTKKVKSNRNLSVSETETYSNNCVNTQVESDKQTNNEQVIEDLNKNQMNLTTKTTSASNDYPDMEEKNNASDNTGIGNILEKYKRLLKFNRNQANSQNLKDDINKNINQETKENTEKVLPKIKSCKKYKISDINNDKVAIPNLLTDIIGSKTENNSAKYLKSINEINIRSRIENSKENSYISNGDLAPKLPSPQNNKLAISVLQQLDMDNPDEEENSSDFNKNDLKFDCGADDFKLDESLLNPKTLLRTVEKEDAELIIPPPPEFSYSNSIYSPEKSGIETNYDDTEFMTESPKLSPSFNYTDDIVSENYLNQEFKEEELTPSKEIETWTLSPDTESNECDSHEINLDLTAPFSAISYPSPFKVSRNIRQSFTEPVTTVNRGILQDFKFTQKDRLRKNTQHMSSLQRGIKKWPHVKRH